MSSRFAATCANMATVLQWLIDKNLVDSPEAMQTRLEVLVWLNDLVKSWVKKVAEAKGMEESSVESANANLYTFGSYRLGVHGPGAFRLRVLLCNERYKWQVDSVTFRDDLDL